MKNLFFILVFAGLAVAVLHSCRKDGLNSQTPENNAVLEAMSNEDIHVRNRILKFRDNVGKYLKNGVIVEVDSALWDIESSINYTYCWDDFDYMPLPNDSLFYQLPLTEEGKVLQYDVDSVYLLIISDLTVVFNAINADVKHMIFSNINEIGSNRDGSSASIIVTTSFGFNPLFIYGSFEEGEDWMYGMDGGMCNDPTTGSDAAEEIEYKLNNPENPPVPPPGGSYYYLYPEHKDLWAYEWPNPDDETENDNLYDYLVFLNYHNGWMPNYHECLPHNEMNFYLAGTAGVINSYPPDGLRPLGKSFISIDLSGTLSPGSPEWHIMHMATDNNTLMYGEQHLTFDPPIDL